MTDEELIKRPLDEEFDTMMEVQRNPCGAWMAIQEQAYQIEALETKLAKAIEVLNFYGDTKNYEIRWVRKDCGCCSDGVRVIPENDKGTIARTALAELRKE